MLDIERMRALVEELYVAKVTEVFGAPGEEALAQIISTTIQIYQRVDPSLRVNRLIVFQQVSTPPAQLGEPHMLEEVRAATTEFDPSCSVEILASGKLAVRPLGEEDLIALSQSSIVYCFDGGVETFVVRGVVFKLVSPSPAHSSVFARPTFSTLSRALQEYHKKSVEHCSCWILKEAWAGENRLFFKAKPEVTMRRSLTQFLSNVLQDAEVRPEQNVDETHPVDIKITWSLTHKRAIIEIKWIGDSIDVSGKPTTSYRDSRARDGAKQLADYLDSDDRWGVTVETRGYLVVFDGRRKGLTQGATSVSKEDALHYEHVEIEYDPDYSSTRTDFERPVRLFMRPQIAA